MPGEVSGEVESHWLFLQLIGSLIPLRVGYNCSVGQEQGVQLVQCRTIWGLDAAEKKKPDSGWGRGWGEERKTLA